MEAGPVGAERLRGALQAASIRIVRNAEFGLFVTGAETPMSRQEKERRRQVALNLAKVLQGLASDDEIETLGYARIGDVTRGLTEIGLVLSGPEMMELNMAYFAANSEFAI